MANLALEQPFRMCDHKMLPKKPLRGEFFVTKFTGVRVRRGLQVMIKSFSRGVPVLALTTLEHLLFSCLLVGQVAVRVKVELTKVVEFRRTQVTPELTVLVLLGVLQELLEVLEHF